MARSIGDVARFLGLITLVWHGVLLTSGKDVGPETGNGEDSVDAGLTPVKKCPVGHFECTTDDSLCVPQASICNSKPDCPDGSDEQNCNNHHDKSFWDSLFYKRPGGETEEMEDMSCLYKGSSRGNPASVRSVRSKEQLLSASKMMKTFSDVGQVDRESQGTEENWGAEWETACQCFSEKLFCQNLHSANLSWLPRDVEFLDLSGSRVNLNDFTTMTFSKLDSLILSNCFIEEIPGGRGNGGGFNKLTRLTTLHLTSNRLRSIPSGTFGNNRNLRSLFLGYNQLTSLLPDSFTGLTSLRELDLRHNRISALPPSLFRPLESLQKLHLNHNELKSLPGGFSHDLSGLEMLSISANSIENVYDGAFENLLSLKGLFLSWNKLTVLRSGMFCNLNSLLNLNLQDNQIVDIDTEAFACLDKLESLNLEKNRFGELKEARAIFTNLTQLRHIYFDQFWMCWWAPHVRFCEPKGDGISSVDNLLDNIFLRSCVWIMGLIGVVGNLFVIVSRMVLREPNRVHSFYIKNLALADLLMGVFLLSIAVHDVKFRGEFLARQHSWRHSFTCQFSGMLSTVSSEASVLILTLITFDRYLSIVRPFAAERSRASIIPALAIGSFLWILSISLAYLPLSGLFFQFFGRDFYSTNGLCLPLNIHNPYDPAWEYSFVLFVVINSSAFLFICYAYWKMLRIIQYSSLTIRSTQEKQDTLLAKRFGLVVLTDFLCWAPVIIAKALAMAGVSIPSTMYAWLAVFVMPVNSALNPVLYTMTTKLFKQQMSKLTIGFRKKLRRGRLDESTASMSIFHRNRSQRTLTSSFGSSVRHSSVKNSMKRTTTMTRNTALAQHRASIAPYGNGATPPVLPSNGIHPTSTVNIVMSSVLNGELKNSPARVIPIDTEA